MSFVRPWGADPLPSLRLGQRYRLARVLGRGGFGTVYEAFDERLATRVAVKVLSRIGPLAVVRFKEEFRRAASLSHPGLVVLHELAFEPSTDFATSEGSSRGAWYFTMDLIDGTDLGVALHARKLGETIATSSASVFCEEDDEWSYVRARTLSEPTALVTNPLTVLGAVARTLAFLHAEGVVHCDLKPSNVLVRSTSRQPVLVDFGLATVVDETSFQARGVIAGTPHYMAPEQSRRDRTAPLGPAADLYALGVMLFEATARRLPFEGEARSVLALKQTNRPPRLRTLDPSCPAVVDALVDALLSVEPGDRPSADVVAATLERLDDDELQGARSTSPKSLKARAKASAHLVGRDSTLVRAEEALRLEAVVVVAGPPGIGKTALSSEVVRRVESDFVMLRARCHERERGPFEVIDELAVAILDALLARGALADDVVTELGQVAAVAVSLTSRLGGTLGRGAVAESRPHVLDLRAPLDLASPRERRALVVTALSRLLARLRVPRQVGLWLEDLHWLDADSRALLADLVATCPVALLVTMRPGSSHGDALLSDLMKRGDDKARRVERVDLEPLDDASAVALVRARLGGVSAEVVQMVLEAAAGNPFLLEELSEHTRSTDVTAPSLEAIVSQRLATLGPEATTVLELLSVAARPTSEVLLLGAVRSLSASAADGDGVGQHLSALYSLTTTRLIHRTGGEEILLRHAAFGAATLRDTPKARLSALHRAMADSILSATPSGDFDDANAEIVARHLVLGDMPTRASHYLDVAAERAMRSLAFERALELSALELGMTPSPELLRRVAIAGRRGDALAALGRGVEASREYASAASLLGDRDDQRALVFSRQAAESLLRAGRVAEGTRALEQVMRRVSLHYPKTRLGAALLIVRSRAQSYLQASLSEDRDELVTTAAPLSEAGIRADAAWSLAMTMGFVDPLVATAFTAQHAMLASGAGGSLRRARVLGSEAIATVGRGEGGRERALDLLRRMSRLGERFEDPAVKVQAMSARGVVFALLGSFEDSYAACASAAELFRATVRDAPWEAATNDHFYLWGAFERGHIAQMIERAPSLYEAALSRGDHYAASGLGAHYANLAWLVHDPKGAREIAARCRRLWQDERFVLPMYDVAMAEAHLDLWNGEVDAHTIEMFDTTWRKLKRSLFLYIEALRVDAGYLRARLLIAAAARGRSQRLAYELRARRAIDAVRHARLAIAKPLADLLDAGLRHKRRDEGAVAALDSAAFALDRVGLTMIATLAKRTVAATTRRSDEVALIDERLVRMGVKAPSKLAATFVPGFEP